MFCILPEFEQNWTILELKNIENSLNYSNPIWIEEFHLVPGEEALP